MKVGELYDYGMPAKLIEIFEKKGLEELFPPQEEAVRGGLLELEDNFVIAIPTASGKTFIGEMFSIKNIIHRGGKVLYIVPLKALATEKLEEFRPYEELGIKVAVATGDYDTSAGWLGGYDIIITTSEKVDSLMRHRPSWLGEVSAVVGDEVHLINDSYRGATMEVVLARLMHSRKDLRLLALSATVNNSREVAAWLGAKLVTSQWRPVELREGVFYQGNVFFSNNTSLEVSQNHAPDLALSLDAVEKEGQCLVFINTRKGAESFALKAAKELKPLVKEEKILRDLAQEVLAALPEPTRTCKRLARAVEGGAAFHHAGLTSEQRKVIEGAFKDNHIKVISATPTLAAGVNLPARRVVVREYRRYDANYGFVPLPVMEIKQMLGRAGRPKYDSFGEAVLIAKSEAERDFLLENYILAPPEDIYSKLAVESSLRTHTLATIAMGYAHQLEGLMDFFSRTFYGYQQEARTLSAHVEKILSFLLEEGFVEGEEKLMATRLGRRTSELYLDPESALMLKEALEGAQSQPTSELSFLHAIVRASEFKTLYLRKNDYEMCMAAGDEHGNFFLFEVPSQFSDPWGYEEFLSQVKTALFLNDWIKERSEDFIQSKYNLGPGDIRSRVEVADWLLYAMEEMAKMFGYRKRKEIVELRTRVKQGIRRELMPFVNLKGIGRVRARKLYNRFKSLEALKEAEAKTIATVPLIGEKMAQNIKAQLHGEEVEEVRDTRRKQSRLTGF